MKGWMRIETSGWSPVGQELLAVHFLKLYQHKALNLIFHCPASLFSHFVRLPSLSVTDTDSRSSSDGQNDILYVEAHLHHYLRRLVNLVLRSLSSLAFSVPSPTSTVAFNDEAAKHIRADLITMRETAAGQLFLPLIQHAATNHIACPLLLDPLCAILSPLRTLQAFFLRCVFFSPARCHPGDANLIACRFHAAHSSSGFEMPFADALSFLSALGIATAKMISIVLLSSLCP